MAHLDFRRPPSSVCALGLALLGVASSDVAARPPQDTVARSAYVTVLDNANAPVANLTASDIAIFEDGTMRQVTDVKPATDPLAVALLVDTAQVKMGSIPPTRDLRTGLSTLIKIVLASNAESQIALMEMGGAAVMSQNFTSKAQDLSRAVGRVVPAQRSSSVVLESLLDISRTISSQKSSRRAIVIVDLDSQETSRVQQDEISNAVQKSGASVWAVSIRGTEGSAAARSAVLEWATDVTGGLRLTAVAPSALESQMQIIANALTSQYLVTYQRPTTASVAQVRAAASRGSKFLATRIVQK